SCPCRVRRPVRRNSGWQAGECRLCPETWARPWRERRMRRMGCMGALVIALIAVTGCGDRKHPVALQGTWKLTGFSHPLLAQMSEARKKKLVTQADSTLTLKPAGEATVVSKPINA